QTEAEARSAAAATAADAAACAAELRALEGLVAADGPRRGAGAALSVPDGLEEAAAAALEDAAREPLAADGDAAGAGWHVLPPFDPPPRLPAGAVPLAEPIGAPPALARRLALTGLVPPEAAPRLWRHLGPGQALVTPDGALWRWDGLRRRPGGAAAAEAEALRRAARLEPCREAARRAGQRAQDARAAEADAARCLR
ncbi:chromosome segregation protein SMC, partial [Rubellimicrobium sp. CFH 75288]|nr:chromosome segregation protein SMC [Rubellimicrobium sp. CFH 75288]